jgi:heat shock protein HtpX
MRRPPAAVTSTDEPGALSAGTGDRTVVCVTPGLLKELDGDEREAVLASELAHLENGDPSVLTVAGFPATVALGAMGAAIDSTDGIALVLGYFGAAALLALVSFVLVFVTLPGTLALSRYREYAGDPRAAPAVARTRRRDGVLGDDAARCPRPAGSCRFHSR